MKKNIFKRKLSFEHYVFRVKNLIQKKYLPIVHTKLNFKIFASKNVL